MARSNIEEIQEHNLLGLSAILRSGIGLEEKKEEIKKELERLNYGENYNLDKKEDRDKIARFFEIKEGIIEEKKEEEVVEVKEERIEKEEDGKVESKLNKLTLDELVAEYEKHQDEAVEKEIAFKTGLKTNQVKLFIEKQREIANKLKEKGIGKKGEKRREKESISFNSIKKYTDESGRRFSQVNY